MAFEAGLLSTDFFFYFLFVGGMNAGMEIWFCSRFAQVGARFWQYAAFMALEWLLLLGMRLLPGIAGFSMLLEIGLLWAFLRVAMGAPSVYGGIAALLAVAVISLCNGIVDILAALLLPALPEGIAAWLASILLALLALGAGWGMLRFLADAMAGIAKRWGKRELVFFAPVLLTLLATWFVEKDVYRRATGMENAAISGDASTIWALGIHVAAFICLLAVLRALWDQSRLAAIEQQLAAQQSHMREAQLRYDATRTFRHDFKNHLFVLGGLLRAGKEQQALEYLGKLETMADSLAFPASTGNAAVDALLSGKLALAREQGIRTECHLAIPNPCPVGETELCALLFNAIDNAMKACAVMEPEEPRFLRISGGQHSGFFVLEVENSRQASGAYPKGSGLGLPGIEAIAGQYGGVAMTEADGGIFRLRVLLNISQQENSIPRSFC